MRSFIVLLLLIVVFLTGMLIGMERKEDIFANHLLPKVNHMEQPENITESEVYEEPLLIEEQMIDFDVPAQTTQKMATFLEAGVKGFYEIVVEVLFQISSLFI